MNGAEWIELLRNKEAEVRARFKSGIESFASHEELLYQVWQQDIESFWVAEALGVSWEKLVDETDEIHNEFAEVSGKWFEEVWVASGKLLEELQ